MFAPMTGLLAPFFRGMFLFFVCGFWDLRAAGRSYHDTGGGSGFSDSGTGLQAPTSPLRSQAMGSLRCAESPSIAYDNYYYISYLKVSIVNHKA